MFHAIPKGSSTPKAATWTPCCGKNSGCCDAAQYDWPAVCSHKQYLKRNVFDRLVDHRFYTGIHRERFDEHGNGRGKAGRDYLHIKDGWAPSAFRPNEVYSTVIKRPLKPVVEPGTLGVQKFGVQVTTPKLIWVFRNGDELHNGEAFFVKKSIRTIDQLFSNLTRAISPFGGPCRKLYDQNFQQVKCLAEIVDGCKYLATSGEPPAPLYKLERFLSPWVYV